MLDRRFSTVRCRCCGTVLVSRHTHDMRGCGCSQQTSVDGGPSYLRFGGKDLTQVEVLVDPSWPRSVRLELLQEALRLARELGGWLEPVDIVSEAAVARVVLWLRGSVAAAKALPAHVRDFLRTAGDWPPSPSGEPMPEAVRMPPVRHRA